jgi:hypothetical protein
VKRDLAHEIIAAMESLQVDESAKAAFRQMMGRICSIHGAAWSRRDDRIVFARKLLALRVSRATIRDRLIARFNVSRGEAYRSIGEALKLSQNEHENETGNRSNGISKLPSGPDENPT